METKHQGDRSGGRWVDPIVADIHRQRQEHARRFNYDIDAIGKHFLDRQHQVEAENAIATNDTEATPDQVRNPPDRT